MLMTRVNHALALICIAQTTNALYLPGTLADTDPDARANIHLEATPDRARRDVHQQGVSRTPPTGAVEVGDGSCGDDTGNSGHLFTTVNLHNGVSTTYLAWNGGHSDSNGNKIIPTLQECADYCANDDTGRCKFFWYRAGALDSDGRPIDYSISGDPWDCQLFRTGITQGMGGNYGMCYAVATTPNPTTAPTPSPTPGPTSAPTSSPTEASATGDPHLQNIHGEKFDLMEPGNHTLIHIPRGARADKTLLRVWADAVQLGGLCADMYFQRLNITGAWAQQAQAGGLAFDSQGFDAPKWMTMGPLEVKVVQGRTDKGTRYLNFYVKHLGHAGFAVGGLLGEDDHAKEAMPAQGCRRTIFLRKKGSAPSEGARFSQSATASDAQAFLE